MRVFFFFLFFFLAQHVNSQSIIFLGENKEPISYVKTNIIDNSGTDVLLFSNKEGIVEIPKSINLLGKIFVEANILGYLTYKDSLFLSGDTSIYMLFDDIMLNQVVITAQFEPKNISDAVHKISIIDRSEINNKGAVTLENVLMQEKQIQFSQDAILGSSMRLQGLSGQNVKILVDGVPVIGRLNGNIDISQINLNNIDRIEIIEGPLSVNYGSDALAGTINLISRKERGDRIYINSYYESVGKYNIDGLYNWGWKSHQFTISGGRNYFDGWSSNEKWELFPIASLADNRRFKEWKPKEQLFIKGQHLFSHKRFNIRTSYSDFYEFILNRGTPRLPYFENAFDDTYRTWRRDLFVDFNTKLSEKSKLNILSSYNIYKRIKNTYYKDLITLNQNITNDANQDTTLFYSYTNRANLISTISEFIDVELGCDISHQKFIGKRIVEGSKKQADYAIYTNIEWEINSEIMLRTGLRASYNTSYNSPLIPSLHIKYSLDDAVIRMSLAQGFRAPSLKELYFEFVDINHNIIGNADLQAETSNNLQFSISSSEKERKNMININLSGFFNDLDNLITLADQNEVYTYINVGEYRTLGGKYDIETTWNRLKFNTGFAFIRYRNKINMNMQYNYNTSTEYSTYLGYYFEKSNINLNTFYKYSGSTPYFSINSQTGELENNLISDYHNLDFTCSTSFFKKKLEFKIGCKNLFDNQSIPFLSGSSGTHNSNSNRTPVSYGRSYFTSIKWNIL